MRIEHTLRNPVKLCQTVETSVDSKSVSTKEYKLVIRIIISGMNMKMENQEGDENLQGKMINSTGS